VSPFDANEAVHRFHNGISRELFIQYSVADPWIAVCRAHYDGVLTDDELSDASDNLRIGLKDFADRFREYNGIYVSPLNRGFKIQNTSSAAVMRIRDKPRM
jgi:hypothetical protein